LESEGALANADYFAVVTANLGMLLFLAPIVKQVGLTKMQVGCCGRSSPCRSGAGSRIGWVSWTLSLACLVSAARLVFPAQNLGTVCWALVGTSIVAMGFYGSTVLGDPVNDLDRSRRDVRNREDPNSVGNLGAGGRRANRFRAFASRVFDQLVLAIPVTFLQQIGKIGALFHRIPSGFVVIRAVRGTDYR
jgi:hypothetical protein